MKFNGLALAPLFLLLAPFVWRELVATFQLLADLVHEACLRFQLSLLPPLNPRVPQIVARIASLERKFP